jgi:hypothetical protein
MSAIQDRIDALEAILDNATTDVTVDGNRSAWNLVEARRQHAELKRQQNAGARPRTAAFDLSGS